MLDSVRHCTSCQHNIELNRNKMDNTGYSLSSDNEVIRSSCIKHLVNKKLNSFAALLLCICWKFDC